MKKEINLCDICKKETPELLSVVLPYQLYEDTTVSFVSWKPIDRYEVHRLDICQDCAKK